MSANLPPLRVLLVEDSEVDAELVLAALSRGYQPRPHRVQTEAALRDALAREPWDIVLCDYALPSFDGPSAVRVIRSLDEELPIVVVSGTIGEEAAVELLKIGANDCLLKGSLARLAPAVQAAILHSETRRARRVAELKRREAEDALRRSVERYRVLFERNPIPMWVYDRSTRRFLEVNDAAALHYGYTREEFLNLSVLDLHQPEDAVIWTQRIGAQENTGPLTRGVWRHRKKDGSLIIVEVVSQPIVHEGVEARITQALDISERKEAEEELSRIKMAVDYASNFISIIDSTGRAIFLNRAHVELFGYDLDEFNAAGGPVAVFVDRDLAEQVGAIVGDTGSWSGEAILRTRFGREVEVFLRVNVVRDSVGRPIAYIGVGTDVGKARRDQRTIAEQAALLDEAQDAIMVCGLDGLITFWNKGAERIFGWTTGEAVGKRIHETLDDPAMHATAMATVVRNGAWSGDLTVRTKDHQEVLIEARWTLVRDERGKPKSILAIETDITEKKQLEAQFFRAQRMESIGTLAGGIAHDLNNVLGPIIMAVDLFKLSITDPKDLELVDTVEVSARRGAEMVRQVLSFARGIEGQRLMLSPDRLLKDLQKIVTETFPKSITLQLEAPEGLWTVLGDPTQLHQVLINLSVNARDAMPSGGYLRLAARNLRVDAHFAAMHREARPGPYVVLDVSDTGTGMPADVAERIFEPFFTTKDVTRGTGLGLSTSLAIIRSHGGFITFESVVGVGTKFSVHLPAEIDDARAAPTGAVAEFPRGHGECILVIDDEASIRSITLQTLEAFGYRVMTAVDGAEGVAKYAQHRAEIAVVMTDMMMPVMDGVVTIRALTKLNPTVKVIAMSGLATKGAEAEAAGEGVKTFLAKPFTAATLLTTLREILKDAS